jgi:hypothetical protein
MSYEGETLDACGLQVDLSEIAVVAVSGSIPNVCGHLILHTPSRGGFYFHVTDVYGYPHYMNASQYQRYLSENHKHEFLRRRLTLPDPRSAELYLESILSDDWTWGILPHNCVSFCEEVIHAGGAEWSSYSNCPVIATDVPQHEVSQFLQTLQGEIYRLYGAPR